MGPVIDVGLKGDQSNKQKKEPYQQESNAKSAHCGFSLDFESHENMTMSVVILCQALCISDATTGKAGVRVAKVLNTSRASLFLLSLVKSKATWMHPWELRFKGHTKKYFFCMIEPNEACR